jgi:hypothetical protein
VLNFSQHIPHGVHHVPVFYILEWKCVFWRCLIYTFRIPNLEMS